MKPTSSTVYSSSFYKQGINFVDIMKICTWSFGVEIKLSLKEELRPFKHNHFRQLLHARVWTHPRTVFNGPFSNRAYNW